MKKFFTFSLALAMCATLYAEELVTLRCGEGIPGADEPQLMGLGISADGRYVCGAIEMGDGYFSADMQTGKVKWDVAPEEDGGELRHIDNNGKAIGFTDVGIIYSYETGETTELKAPFGYRYILGEDITPDGSIMVGELVGSSFNTTAAYSTDGKKWTRLPIPSDEELGGIKVNTEISAAKYISRDGNTILGFIGSFSAPIIWKRNSAGDYVPDFFLPRFVKITEADIDNPDKPLYSISAMYLNMSKNGRYASMLGLLRTSETSDGYLDVPVIYNTETGILNVYSEKQTIDDNEWGLYPTAICDNGAFIGSIGQPYYMTSGSFVMKPGAKQAERYADAFPAFAEKYDEADSLGFNMPTGLSSDGTYILGYVFYSDDYNDTSTPAYYETYVLKADLNDAVEDVETEPAEPSVEAIYSIDGHRLPSLAPGLNILRMSDGTARKVIR